VFSVSKLGNREDMYTFLATGTMSRVEGDLKYMVTGARSDLLLNLHTAHHLRRRVATMEKEHLK
jgi:hypothetical protein